MEREMLHPLHVEGIHLVDSNGERISLRGVSTHGISLYPQYLNPECMKQLKEDFHANVIRLAMYTAEENGYCTGGDQKKQREMIRNAVRLANEQQLYVIVDWHILSDASPMIHKQAALTFFDTMAKDLASYSNVLYEICNEPNGTTTWDEIRAYAREVIPVIRKHDRDAVILVGTPMWSQRVDHAAQNPLCDFDNIMYTLHFYAATHKQQLRNILMMAVEQGLPVFVSEYGICDASGNGELDLNEAEEWITLLDRYDISYIAWNLSNKDESSAMICPDCDKTAGFTEQELTESGQWVRNMLRSHDCKQ